MHVHRKYFKPTWPLHKPLLKWREIVLILYCCMFEFYSRSFWVKKKPKVLSYFLLLNHMSFQFPEDPILWSWYICAVNAGCDPEFFGTNCRAKCSYPYFGIDCQERCDCTENLCNVSIGCLTLASGSASVSNITCRYSNR